MAERHRRQAEELRHNERRFCETLDADALDAPFNHRADIVRVTPIYVNKAVAGARVVFRRVPGLSLDWLMEAAHCHQARAAANGYRPSFTPRDPLAAGPTYIATEPAPDGLALVIQGKEDWVSLAVLARARALLTKTPPVAPEN